MGRTTEFTVGRVVDISWDGYIDYLSGRAWFQDQLLVDGGDSFFSAPGDSGSLVVTLSTLQPVGLLFGGGGNRTICNPIRAVMRALSIPRI
jgi:hypothetical protein